MKDRSDAQLLRKYAESASEEAFCEIVGRHTGLVYSAALRQLNSPDLGREIAQSVFIDLGRKAKPVADKLTENASLAGWLYQSTRYAVLKLLRDERRRKLRERQVMEQLEHLDSAPETALVWEHVSLILDEAMSKLDEQDRDALLLRFFQNQDFRAVGLALGVSDDAAQKRVSRSLVSLREQLAHHGINATVGSLAIVISANAIQVVPVGLVATISTAAACAGTTAAMAATATLTKVIAMTTLQKTLITASFLAAISTGIYEAHQALTFQAQVQAFKRQAAVNAGQIEQLNAERDTAIARQGMLQQENERLKGNLTDLARLRGEVNQLRQRIGSQKPQVTQVDHTPGAYIPKEQIAFAGYATPEAALETMVWANLNGTYDQLLECLTPDFLAQTLQDASRREQFETLQRGAAQLYKGMQIVAKKVLADDRVELKFKNDHDTAISQLPGVQHILKYGVQTMVRVANDWKLDGLPHSYQESWEDDGQVEKFVR